MSIGINLIRCVAQITASLIRNNHTKAGLNERMDLITPAVPEIGMSVQKDNYSSD
ncbi:hypothetical protein GCM10027355_32790 [Haloplanus salinarum]